MGTPDSREYDRLKKRNFRPYSRGHQMMYLLAIERLGGEKRKIFEAGFGIGFGIDKMLEAGVVSEYVGCEPNEDSFRYVHDRLGVDPRITLQNIPFDGDLENIWDIKFDAAFCIEVIEHVPAELHQSFLNNLRRMSPRLFFSTPDIKKAPSEGVRETMEWASMLKKSGWDVVKITTDHWTHLYDCR